MQPNPVVFWELASSDAERSVRFFKNVFNWNIKYFDKVGIHEIAAADPESFNGGGIFTLKKPRLPFLTVYIRVDNIEESARRIIQFGGMIVEPIKEIPGGSRICLFNEPSGVTFAMIEYARPAK